MQTSGITDLIEASPCNEASKKALACATAHGENKTKMCQELFDTYKACRKRENAEVVRKRRENRKGLFWD